MFYIKRCFDLYKMVDINHLKEVFPTITDHNLRKQIKYMGGKELEYEKKIFQPSPEDSQEYQESNQK